MITRIYLACRMIAYILSLGGLFYLLGHMQDTVAVDRGKAVVFLGFLFFFVSYFLRWKIRRQYQAQMRAEREERQAQLRIPADEESGGAS